MAKKNTLVRNASILMVATIVSRIIGLIYRRPLGEILGTVGLGYYGYASNLYSILLLISSYSIPMAVSKIVSERLAKKDYRNSHKIFKGALIYAVVVGGAFALIAFFLGGFLLPANQQNALPALRVLAPTIFLSAILGVFRGYFQAHSNMTPTSISQIAEQIMNAIVSILAAWILISTFAPDGGTQAAIYGSVGGTMGTGAGVIVGLLFMLFVYKINRKTILRRADRDPHTHEESYKDIFGIIFMMITPIILTTFINNASMYLDSYIYSSIQGLNGIKADLIASAYGEFSNYFIPIINIPLALASASAAAMMPEVSGSYALGNYRKANGQINQTLRLTMFICIPCTLGLTVLAVPVMGVLFPGSTALSASLLMTGSSYVVVTAVSTVTGSVLQSIGKQRSAMINAALALGINLALQSILLLAAPQLDIFAVMIASIVFSLGYCIFNALALKKYLGFTNEYKKTYFNPFIASVGMAAVVAAIYYLLLNLTRRPFIGLIVSIIVGIVVYLILFVLVSKMKEDELATYPLGGKLVVFLKKIRIYR